MTIKRCLAGCVLFGVLALLPAASYAAARQAQYTLSFSRAAPRRFHVNANLPVFDDSIGMAPSGAAPLPEGWGSFVHDLKATDAHGRPLKLISLGNGQWKLPAAGLGRIHLAYDVAIDHDDVRWTTSGTFAKAYAVERATFFSGMAAFVAAAGAPNSPIRIDFRVPVGWRVATGYRDIPGHVNAFEAEDLNDLFRNGTMVGDLLEKRVGSGAFDVAFVAPRGLEVNIELFQQALEPIIGTYTKVMGGAPKGKLVIMTSVAPYADGGEAFSHSISLMFRAPPDLSTKGRWAYLISHEIFHLWNGHAIHAADRAEVEWFIEGFTDYMAKLTAYRTGLITQAELFAQIATSYDRYLSAAGKVSLKSAGAEKGRYVPFLYYGGMSAAIALDIEARTRSSGNHSFYDVMRRTYAEFGSTHRDYTYADLVRIAGQTVGVDQSAFFSSYVAGTDLIPLGRYLASVGIKLSSVDGKTMIERNAAATTEQRKLFP